MMSRPGMAEFRPRPYANFGLEELHRKITQDGLTAFINVWLRARQIATTASFALSAVMGDARSHPVASVTGLVDDTS